MIIKLLMTVLVSLNYLIIYNKYCCFRGAVIPMMLTVILCFQEKPTDSLTFWLAFV